MMAAHDNERDPMTVFTLVRWPDGTLEARLGMGVTRIGAALALLMVINQLAGPTINVPQITIRETPV